MRLQQRGDVRTAWHQTHKALTTVVLLEQMPDMTDARYTLLETLHNARHLQRRFCKSVAVVKERSDAKVPGITRNNARLMCGARINARVVQK